MQTQQTAYVAPLPAQEADAQVAGGDAWARSAGMVIGSLVVIGVLFIGALVYMYFGAVQSKGTLDVVALKVVDPAPVAPPARAEPPAPVAAEPVASAPAVGLPEVPLRDEPRLVAVAAPEPVAQRSPAPPVVVAEPQSPPSRPSPARQEAERRVTAAAPTTLEAETPRAVAVRPSVKTLPIEAARRSDAIAPVVATAAPAAAPPAPAQNAAQVAAVAPAPPAEPVETPAPVVLRPLSRPQPSFPIQALREGVNKGSVVARLSIGTDGRVTDVAIVSSNPPRLFDRATQRALSEWRFEPIPRPTTAQIELAFRAE